MSTTTAPELPTAPPDPDGRPRHLRPEERDAIAVMIAGRRSGRRRLIERHPATLRTVIVPLEDVWCTVGLDPTTGRGLIDEILEDMADRNTPWWAWTGQEWLATARRTRRRSAYGVLAAAYLLCGHRSLFRAVPGLHRRPLAALLFGRSAVDTAVERVVDQLRLSGYSGSKMSTWTVAHALCGLLLDAGSAELEALDAELLAATYATEPPSHPRWGIRAVALALTTGEFLPASPLPDHPNTSRSGDVAPTCGRDVAQPWAGWCERWYRTSTLTRAVRRELFYILAKAGRWVAAEHPGMLDPAGWTRAVAAEWVAAVDRMRVGDWTRCVSSGPFRTEVGRPLRPPTKSTHIGALRTFFRDCQEWGWIPCHFDPSRAFVIPRSVKALIGPEPRVIADDVWAKLLWAGLNLTADDMPRHAAVRATYYPIEMLRALAAVWLFAGLRLSEISRLRLGCIRWQEDGAGDERRRVCLLDVPAHKTGMAFTKPVDRMVGHAIDQWVAVRPRQPEFVDARTSERVDLLFVHKGMRIGQTFINAALIPSLCRKANVPLRDVRGSITSHRARATIASQLYNAREPMTLFELQAWLGHRSPASTQHYAKITPTTLTRAYAGAGYFDRNLRTIAVLVDREAATSGAAAAGQPWQFYDLGHGHCTYSFFEQCPHRMACARCDFYIPKASSKGQLLEASANLQRMLVEIPLTEVERAAVEDGGEAVTRLLDRLADVATPSERSSRESCAPCSADGSIR